MKIKNTPHRLEKGQSLTELSITMTLVLILLAGVADIGRAFFTYITLRDAAQEGALYGSFAFSAPATNGTPNGLISPGTACTRIADRIKQNSDAPVDLASDTTISVQVAKASNSGTWVNCTSAMTLQPCAYDRIRVRVTYDDFTVSTPFLGAIIGSQSVDISAAVEDTILAPAGTQTSLCP